MMISGSMAQGAMQPALPQTMRVARAKPAMPPQDSGNRVWTGRSLAAHRTSAQRVAALLSGISRNNSYEGRDAGIISNSLTSGFVAELLGLTVSELANSLVELEDLGLVAQAQGGALRLLDRPALDRLIDAY